MVKDAEANAEADKQRKEVDLRNDADALLFTVDKTLKELEGKVDAEEVKKQKMRVMNCDHRSKRYRTNESKT